MRGESRVRGRWLECWLGNPENWPGFPRAEIPANRYNQGEKAAISARWRGDVEWGQPKIGLQAGVKGWIPEQRWRHGECGNTGREGRKIDG